MRVFSCPDCAKSDCCGCPRVSPGLPGGNNRAWKYNSACVNCPTNPENGGSGNCNCTLGGDSVTVSTT